MNGTSADYRRTSIDVDSTEVEDESVTIRPVEGIASELIREVRISCPDATGLGCDVARLLLDFGLGILEGDLSTDGKWCFQIFKVRLSSNMKPQWGLLKQRLKKICYLGGATIPLWHTKPVSEDYGQAFLLSVSSYDRSGFLHDLMHTLWEADLLVFKAHITTGPGGRILDMFWIHDYRSELPAAGRVLQIRELVQKCLQQPELDCKIEPAPANSSKEDSAAVGLKRCACVDASAFSPLRRLLSVRRKSEDRGGVVITTQADEFGTPDQIQVGIDNCTTAAYSVVTVRCGDRKGLVYDLMRTMKDIHIRVAYAKVKAKPRGLCAVELFVQEVDGSRILDPELQGELIDTVRSAVTLPLKLDIRDVYDDTCTELLVTAFLDSGGRGRPRVTYDVTTALSSLGLCVFMADIYIDVLKTELDRPVELHRFLIHRPDSRRLESAAEKRALYQRVRAQLMGTQEKVPEPQKLPAREESNAEVVLESLSTWNWKG